MTNISLCLILIVDNDELIINCNHIKAFVMGNCKMGGKQLHFSGYVNPVCNLILQSEFSEMLMNTLLDV